MATEESYPQPRPCTTRHIVWASVFWLLLFTLPILAGCP